MVRNRVGFAFVAFSEKKQQSRQQSSEKATQYLKFCSSFYGIQKLIAPSTLFSAYVGVEKATSVAFYRLL